MSSRNALIDNLRGISVLGVLGIHVGTSLALMPNPNIYLYFLFEILSRYSVPAFFFISGFGLFSAYSLERPLAYLPYLKKRLLGVGLPYLVWSLLYLAYYNFITPGSVAWNIPSLFFILFFGLASYHIYFMVILLWFYLLLPLWRSLMRYLLKLGLVHTLPILFLAQIIFNYWTCRFWSYPAWVATSPLLLNLLNYRLNYLPLHYLFIFILGGIIALYYQQFTVFSKKYYPQLTLFFAATILLLTARAYYLYYVAAYPLESITNTLQQLSTEGFLYTIAALLFFTALLQRTPPRTPWLRANNMLADNSYVIYLIHPFFLDIISSRLLPHLPVNANKAAIITYLLVLICSLGASRAVKILKIHFPLCGLLLTGKKH